MGLAIAFLGADDLPRTEFTLAGRDGEFQLPRILISSEQPDAWVESCSIISCTGEGLTPELRDALTRVWPPSTELGSLPLLSRPARIAAAVVAGPARLRVDWEISYRDDGFCGGFLNDADPQRAQASVQLALEAADDSTTSKEAPFMAIPGSVHKGHVAIDFGTSNCTATLLDIEELPTRVLSVEQARKLRQGLLKLMNDPDRFGPDGKPEFEECLNHIGSIVLDSGAVGSEAVRRLLSSLSGEDDREPRLLYSVLVALEQKVNLCSAYLRPRLTSTLAGLYADAWRVPPLDRLRLFPVVLDAAAGATEIESKVSVTRDPWRVTVGKPVGILGAAGADALVVYAGLKQRLGQTKPYPELGDGVTSDTLLRDSLGDLLGRTNDYIAATPGLGSGRADSVVITYPTMASPAVRHKLRGMLAELGVSRIDTSYDEAIAAALFFLLRDFGGDHDMGLEVFRARCRPTNRPDQWVQNMLVIDIGGGTADIALLTLTLADSTPGRMDPHRHGRYYEVRPEVRGSTGRLQQGGELTTLRVFYWLKAAIADRLLTGLPDRFKQQRSQLDQLGLGDLNEDPFTRWTGQREPKESDPLFKVLDSIVPTRSKDGASHPGPTFWVLWSLAEQKKLELCGPDGPARVPVSALEVRNVLRSVDQGREADDSVEQAEIPDADLVIDLTAEKFEALIANDIDDVIGAALSLAEERLNKGETPEPLDRVILTGQASKAPLVRRLVQAQFAGSDEGKNALRCRPSSILVEEEYAKRATSVGASWARSIWGLGHGPEGAVPHLEKGHNELFLDVKNLFFHLPCAFSLVGQLGGGSNNVVEILSTGLELYQLSPLDQDPAARSDWFELNEYFDIYRKGQGDNPRWGAFRWDRDLDGAPGLDRAVWPRQVHGSVEANSALDLHLLLCRGDTRHYLVDGPSIPAVPAESDRGGRWLGGGRGSSRPVHPGDIEVNAFGLGGNHEGEAIFPQARHEGAEDPEFPEYFHPAGDTTGAMEFRGLIGEPLPEPPRDGVWTFHYRDESGTLHRIGELAPPERTSELRAHYIPTLDEHGNLRVHDCSVPYWPAETALDVQNFPGRVLRIPIETPPDQENPAKDPFNGTH